MIEQDGSLQCKQVASDAKKNDVHDREVPQRRCGANEAPHAYGLDDWQGDEQQENGNAQTEIGGKPWAVPDQFQTLTIVFRDGET